MATRKAKRKTKPVRKAARKPAPKRAKKAAARKAAVKAAPKAAAPKLPPRWSATQQSEFDAIQERAKALSADLKRTDFDTEGNPLPGPWASMLADLDAWARKYRVKARINEHEHPPAAGGVPAGGATPTPMSHCPGTTTGTDRVKIGKKYYNVTKTCNLRRETWLGRCVYDCYESGFTAV